MSEENNRPLNAQEELLRKLKSIGVDLWGGMPGAAGSSEEADRSLNPDIEQAWRQELGKRPGQTGEQRSPASSAEHAAGPANRPMEEKGDPRPRRKPTSLDNLWITADETIDWTDALLWDTPRDGLTGQKLWNFYHRMAPKVLEGQVEAYAEVLTTLNPLGDLTEYVSGMILRTPGPDRLECVFECQPEDLQQRGRDYLGALSLRIARDLLAALPVSEVMIQGNLAGQEKIQVTFRREQMLKQKMAFLNPAEFVEACGGRMTVN